MIFEVPASLGCVYPDTVLQKYAGGVAWIHVPRQSRASMVLILRQTCWLVISGSVETHYCSGRSSTDDVNTDLPS